MIAVGAALTSLASALCAQPAVPLYKNADAPVAKRVKDLLSRMTLEEKVAQLQAQGTLPPLSPGGAPTAMAIVSKGQVNAEIARKSLKNGIGVFFDIAFGPLGAADQAEQQNAIQQWVLTNTRLGIPVLFQSEALHGAVLGGATSFPQAIGLGSTWDPALIRQMFAVVGREARAGGIAQVLAPVFDLSRDPRYGRVEERYSEDPYLTGTMGVAAVQGLQGTGGTIDQDHVIATAKHFIHGQPENGTNIGPSDFSERTMRQTFLKPFEMAVKIGPIGAILPSYNEDDGGIPSQSNPWLLRDVLRGEWGFKGITVSDWGAVSQLHDKHFVAPTYAAAGEMALAAGVDMELPTPVSYATLAQSVRAGKINRKVLDEAVSEVLAAKFRAGLFEHPYADLARATAVIGAKEHGELARKVADEAMVLLKNDAVAGGTALLPLDPANIHTIAVIGPNADKMRLGTYSSVPPYYVTVLDGIRRRLGDKVTVSYAEGVRISEPDKSPDLNKLMPYRAPSAAHDADLIAQAVETARAADVVVLVLGGNEMVSREAISGILGRAPSLGDTDTLELPGRQNDLIRAVSALGKPVVAVLLNGRPYSSELLDRSAPAILEGWYLGQETGNAVAGALFGDTNPSGRLPVTIARNVGQLPVFYYQTPAARLGYVFNSNKPLYPFGFGLSYTSFAYGAPKLDRASIRRGETARASVSVTNTGARDGDEVVQLYVHPRYASVVQPVMRLAGFQRVHLKAGETTTVSFAIGPEQLAIWNRKMQHVVETGPVEVMIGRDAATTASTELQVFP